MQRLDKTAHTNMTHGAISAHLVRFAIPLLAGNLLQLLYSFVDAWVVGNYVSDTAFSAIGTVVPVIDILINLFLGLASGASAVISQLFGAKNFRELNKTVHTAIALSLVLSVVASILGTFASPILLKLMRTPNDVFIEAQAYLTIYCAGLSGLLIYNMNAAILQAVGDSKHPFCFLVISTISNALLDLIFVICFGFGIRGVAWATVISQLIAALLSAFILLHGSSPIRINAKVILLDNRSIKLILRVGLPASFQMAVTALSNVFVQSYINQFGKYVMGGWAAYTRLDSFFFLPAKSFATATMTFVGQNLGAGNYVRARKGVKRALWLSVGITTTVSIFFFVFALQTISMFTSQPQIIGYGVQLLRWNLPFYGFVCVYHVYAGAFRGSERSREAMAIMLTSFVLVRQIYLYIMSKWIANRLIPLSLSYPAGWLMCAVMFVLFDYLSPMKKHGIEDAKKTNDIYPKV